MDTSNPDFLKDVIVSADDESFAEIKRLSELLFAEGARLAETTSNDEESKKLQAWCYAGTGLVNAASFPGARYTAHSLGALLGGIAAGLPEPYVESFMADMISAAEESFNDSKRRMGQSAPGKAS